MNTIKFIVVVSIVLLSTDLINHQIVNAVTIETDKGDCTAIVDTGKESEKICKDLIKSLNETNTANQSPSELNKSKILENETYAQTNDTNKERSFMNCYDGTMKFFLLQIMFSPPEIKFNISDLTSPEMKQYISDSCNFYHEKSGLWLSGTDDELDKKIVSKYGAEFMQKIKQPESLKLRDEGYVRLNNKTNGN